MLLSPSPMHIPDGFLSLFVSVIFWILSVIVISVALKKVQFSLGDKQLPLMGILAAAIFAGQMLNFSVAGGTSGHLMGAAIATIVLGPWAAILVLTSVVSVQALVFQDGGLLVLGANIFNMAIIGVTVSYAIYQLFRKMIKRESWYLVVSSFLSAWFSIFVASLAVGLQLAVSGTSPVQFAVPAMAGIHALIGIGEGLITVGAVSFFKSVRPDLLFSSNTNPVKQNRPVWILGSLITLFLVVLSPLASTHPDGLEWVAEKLGFLAIGQTNLYQILPDYAIPGLNNQVISTIVAGIIGAVIVFGVMYGVAISRKKVADRDSSTS